MLTTSTVKRCQINAVNEYMDYTCLNNFKEFYRPWDPLKFGKQPITSTQKLMCPLQDFIKKHIQYRFWFLQIFSNLGRGWHAERTGGYPLVFITYYYYPIV